MQSSKPRAKQAKSHKSKLKQAIDRDRRLIEKDKKRRISADYSDHDPATVRGFSF